MASTKILSDIEQFISALREHAHKCDSVTSIRIPGVLPRATFNESFLTSVLRGCRAFPSLEEIILIPDPVTPIWMDYIMESLSMIMLSTNWSKMKRLHVTANLHLIVVDEHWLRGLKHADLLEEFTVTALHCSKKVELLNLVETLARLPRLKKLHLTLTSGSTKDMLNATTVTTLAQSTTLQSLRLVNFHVTDDLLAAFCDAISSNDGTALEEVILDDFLPRITETGCLHLWKLLQTNFTLTDFLVHCDDAGSPFPVEAEVYALCKLNKAGRGRISRDPTGATLDDWLRLMEAAGENVGALFLLLLKHPAVCAALQLQGPCVDDDIPADDNRRDQNDSLPTAKRPRLC